MMDQRSGLPGLGGQTYASNDPSLQVPVTSRSNLAPLSPYLNFDPSIFNQEAQFILPEGASSHRGRFELAFAQIGTCFLGGTFVGTVNGIYKGLQETRLAGHVGSVKRTQMLNFITKYGPAAGNACAGPAVMYSTFGVALQYFRGTDDFVNTMTASTLTGLLYKSTAGLRKCGLGGLAGFGIGCALALWSGRDQVSDFVSRSRY